MGRRRLKQPICISRRDGRKSGLDNSGEGESVEIGSSGGAAGVSSESFGGMSISYATGGSGSGSDAAAYGSSWGSTVYGRRFTAMALKVELALIVSV